MNDLFSIIPWAIVSPALLEIVSVFVIFGLIFTPSTYQRRDFLFSYVTISISVFILAFLLHHLEFELSLAVGLFAIFGILRFRTDPIPIKEMAYLFVSIAMSIINALSFDFFFTHQVFIANVMLWIVLAWMERVLYHKKNASMPMVYDRIALLAPDKESELLEDLHKRTGLNVIQVKVKQFDLLKETADIIVYFSS
ncbi:DUF4956 domain-containing protein [Halosquirtibacter xylanolyticus]|uniref:DUF4956 domain-containing protein n=1 Tax=Halosquirtibacter xylanolyticus TaxID=3374599 RepID=UPI003748C041|nr:DUF4956 domain-containing protein [Prolixibacteraceae bacterium]